MTQRVLMVLVLCLALVPVAAYAGTDEARNVTMGANGMVQDSKENGDGRSHNDIKPRGVFGKAFDPNKKKLSPDQLRDLYNGLDALLVGLPDNPAGSADRAWNGCSQAVKAALSSLGIDKDNWKSHLRFVNVLPRRVDVLAVDQQKGSGGIMYETQNRPFTESYTTQEPIWGPVGCGCRGSQVVGYQDVTSSRTVYRPVQVAVAAKVPVVKSAAILTPFDGKETLTVPRQEQYTYYESVPVYAPLGCGCRGSYVVGYQDVSRTGSRTVYDTVTRNYTTFDAHLTQMYTVSGNSGVKADNKFLAEGSYTQDPSNPNMVIKKTDDSGNVLVQDQYAEDKAEDLAKNRPTEMGSDAQKASTDPNYGKPINNNIERK